AYFHTQGELPSMSFVHDLPEFSGGDKVRESLTLRKMMEKYRDSGGRFWRDAKVPELSITSENDSIASMVLFNNVIGYPVKGKVVCGVPQVYENVTRMLGAVEDWIRNALHSGQLWCPPGATVYTRLKSGWYAPGGQVPDTVSRCLDVLNSRNFSPLSVSTLHAALECEYTEAPNPYVNVYQFPRTTTPSTGLLGTWHNNLSVDVSPWEKDKEPDTEARSFKDHCIMEDQESNDDVGSYLPGENMCVLYHNMPLTYEDSVVVSSKYRDMEYVSSSKVINVSSAPTGTVVSSHILKSGERSVRVRSFEQFQTGNKIATGHGQKGVATVIPFCEMPVVKTSDGCTIIPDMVMSVSSIIMRQTPGQFYEGSAAMSVLRGDTSNRIVEVCDTFGMCEDFQVMDSRTGKLYRSLVTKHVGNSPGFENTRATVGYVRVYNMTQNTREKHFTSHSRPGKFSLRTPVRRSRGGGVAWGEMEVQACVAAGLSMCVEELRKRGDEIVVLVCTVCQRLRLLHSCTNDTDFVEVSLPYDTVVLDCVNRIVHNTTFKYGLAADV
ncbi:hypothetical protein ACKVWL_011530, partial [Pyricularia oryzae]